MERSSLGRGLHSIGNKMLAVLVTVAVLPAVAVSLYALRKTSDALSEQALTLISEACVTDARRAEDILDRVHQDLRALVKGDSDLKRLLAHFDPGQRDRAGGEVQPHDERSWNAITRDLATVDQKLRALLEQQPGCARAFVRSLGFAEEDGRAVVWLEAGAPVRSVPLLERDRDGYLRALPEPADTSLRDLLVEWRNASDEHPERDVLRATVTRDDGDAIEMFAARVQTITGEELGWVFLVHSWRRILEGLRAGEGGADAGHGVTSVFAADRLAPIATTRPGRFVDLPEEFGLRDHARSGQANAALFESGEIVAFAPFFPRRDDVGERFVLAVDRPARELLASVHRFRVVFTGVLAAALLLASLVGIAFARRLTQPLRELRDGAIRIGRGDLGQALNVRTGDEAEELAREFNAMASQLRSLYEGMEQTIRERTDQLQRALDDLRRAHGRIVESEARYSDIVENASDLIQVTDAAGRIVSANRRQAELLGTSVGALRGRPFLELVAPEARDATRNAFERVLAGGTLNGFESALALAGGGRSLPVEISATPVLADGAPAGVRAILRDVSERKLMEARLIKAERLSSVGALAAGVAHEINNPMGIIMMFAQRVLERARKGSPDVDVDVEKLEKILEQARRVAGITRNLLDFARAAPTSFAPFRIADVIQSTCALVSDRARTAQIELEVDVAPSLPEVRGNAQQVSQVILNLLLNSIQAIGRGGRIAVRAAESGSSRLPAAGRALRVTVDDSGPGIAPESLPRLFEPFFTTKAPGEGTGLGLSVSYGILKEHHGAIFAENRAEGGARFEFELPLEASGSESGGTNLPIGARRER